MKYKTIIKLNDATNTVMMSTKDTEQKSLDAALAIFSTTNLDPSNIISIETKEII